jgi:hypothetical protein
MSAQSIHRGTPPEFRLNSASRAVLRTRPRYQRIMIRSWEYIPAVRATILAGRLVAALVLVAVGTALIGQSNGWAAVTLAGAVAAAALGSWIFAIASRGWPRH